MSKIKLEDIKSQLQQNQWEVISQEYKNLEEEMIFRCPEGHQVYSSWKNLRNKLRCPLCEQNSFKMVDTKIIPKKKGIYRVLALDQATKISGFSIFDNQKLVTYGKFETDDIYDTFARDVQVRNWLVSMINNWKPDIVAIEGIQLQEKNDDSKMGVSKDSKIGVTTFETLARLQGILMITCNDLNTPFEICPTNTWRNHNKVKGRSRTDKKRSMQLIAKQIYDITISEDEADAIGIGKYLADKQFDMNQMESWE